jgi:hypothetical protein
MRPIFLLVLLVPGLARASFINIESSHTYATASAVGCYVVRWGADDGAVSEYACGAASDYGVDEAGAAPVMFGSTGQIQPFGIGVWRQQTIATDDVFEIVAREYWGGNCFEGNAQASFGWTGVFTLSEDALLSTTGFGGGLAIGSDSLMIRHIPSGELILAGEETYTDFRLAGGSKYAITWTTSEQMDNLVTGGFATAGAAGWGSLSITKVPEPNTFVLFSAAILVLVGFRRTTRQ